MYAIIIFIISIIMFACGIYVIINHFRQQKEDYQYIKINATISKIYHPKTIHKNRIKIGKTYVNFTFDGQEYKNIKYPVYNSFFQVGDKLEIYIDPDDLSNVGSVDDNILIGILIIIFSLFMMTLSLAIATII